MLAGSLAAACAPYFGACAADSDCCGAMSCVAGKCNQVASLCSNVPTAWANPQITTGGSTAGSPYDYTVAQQEGIGTAVVKNTGGDGFYRQGWFSDWNVLGIIGAFISALIIAVAAMIGEAFNLSEVKAFARSEMIQVLLSILLIAGLLAAVKFFDVAALEVIDVMKLPVTCASAEPCYLTAAKSYLGNVQDVADQYAQSNLKESYERMRIAMRGANVQFNVWYLLFAGTSTRWNAGESIRAERSGALFESASKLIVSIYAQKYFLDVVAFGIAPVFLLLGIVLRTFFFTRKLGGLLLAIAISLFIVYPLTFAFAWFTLNVTVYGERSVTTVDPSCPVECTARYPVAFFVNQTGSMVQFDTAQDIMRAGITSANWGLGDVDGNGISEYPGLVACRDLSSIGIGTSTAPPSCTGCPDYCREVPFPERLPGCNIAQCSSCNPGCKLMRQRYDCSMQCNTTSCDKECLVTQPVENKCFNSKDNAGNLVVAQANLSVNCATCSGCPSWCRIAAKNADGSYSLVNKDQEPCKAASCQPQDESHPLGCPVQCMYVSGVFGNDNSCDNLCTDPASGVQCPNYCRVKDINSLSAYDTSDPSIIAACSDSRIAAACAVCPSACKVQVLPESETNNATICAPYPVVSGASSNCMACPAYCRFGTFLDYAGYSNLQTESQYSTLPFMCSDSIYGLDCSASSCNPSVCSAPSTPVLCAAYSASSSGSSFCTKCPEGLRGVSLTHPTNSGGTENTQPSLSSSISCGDSACPVMCKAPATVLAVPSECVPYNPSGAPLNCHQCPDEVRGLVLHHVDSDASEQTVQPLLSPTVVSGCADSTCQPYCKQSAVAEVATTASDPQCMDFNPSGGISGCGQCPIGCRVKLSDGNWLDPACNIPACSIANCADACKAVPSPPAIRCMDYDSAASSSSNCQLCPTSCRLSADPAFLDSALCGNCADAVCAPACKASASAVPPKAACLPYKGNGAVDWAQYKCQGPSAACSDSAHNTWSCDGDTPSICQSKTTASDCNALNALPNNCRWAYHACENDPDCGVDFTSVCHGEANDGSGIPCATHTDLDTCVDVSGCRWGSMWAPDTPISTRAAPYNDVSSCQQCPENCRLAYSNGTAYSGPCDQWDGSTYDCSVSSCPVLCRTTVPSPSPAPPSVPTQCLDADLSVKSCGYCPALCRRFNESSPGSNISCNPAFCGSASCIDGCRLPDPPKKMCEGCSECPSDCLYTPATVSDCTAQCTDEALAGPINTGPGDFIKKLPGAQGEEDVKGIGVLMMPALVLPLFGIVIVLSFIRTLSPLLGGDIEIPGIGRII